MSALVDEFATYIFDIFANARAGEREAKLLHVLGRFEGAAVHQAAQTMLEIDVDCCAWSDDELAKRMLQHVSFRGSKTDMLPAHCMMLEASRRLGRVSAEASP
jgi:hypothetical protein